MKYLKNPHSISRHILSFIVISLLSCILAACGDNDKGNLDNYVKEIKRRPAYPIETIPEFRSTKKYTYPKNKSRSPFKQITKRRVVSGTGPNRHRPKEPLEMFPLDSLRMVGLLRRDEQLWAIVSTPNNAVYRVKLGNYLGQNYGRVAKIGPHEVKIIETILVNNNWQKRPVTLTLDKEE